MLLLCVEESDYERSTCFWTTLWLMGVFARWRITVWMLLIIQWQRCSVGKVSRVQMSGCLWKGFCTGGYGRHLVVADTGIDSVHELVLWGTFLHGLICQAQLQEWCSTDHCKVWNSAPKLLIRGLQHKLWQETVVKNNSLLFILLWYPDSRPFVLDLPKSQSSVEVWTSSTVSYKQ